MTSVAFAPCFSALRFLFPIREPSACWCLPLKRTIAPAQLQLQPDELRRHVFILWRKRFSYGGYSICYGDNQTSYGENFIFYGGNHIALWRKLHLAMAKII